jgi:hypothetical protein
MISLLTWGHVLISLAGIAAGFVVVFEFLVRRSSPRVIAVFLATTTATSATGYLFPVTRFLPSHAVGIVSLLVLAVTIYAYYRRRLEGGWKKVFVIGSVVALYLNVFVAVVQSFMKIQALKALAPTQSEPPFKTAQLAVLVVFVVLGVVAVLRNRETTMNTNHKRTALS